VVDAGGKGFVRLIEGIVRLIDGEATIPEATEAISEGPPVAATVEVAGDRDFQYCTEVLVRGTGFPPSTELRATLRPLGGSIVVLATDDLLKVHIHTDTPAAVRELAGTWGAVEDIKADDMRAQHQALEHAARDDVAIVVDSSCDLSDATIDEGGFVITPLLVMDGDHTYQDRIDLRATEVYERMRLERTAFTTSQPAPGAFAEAYRDAQGGAQHVLCLTLSGGLSGTLASARAAAERMDGVTVFDSRSASLGLGMLALRARELARQGLAIDEVVRELLRVRERSGGLITVDSLDNLVRSGRISRGKGWLGRMLDIKPILALTPEEGKIEAVDRVRGTQDLLPRVLEHLDRLLTPRPRRLRVGVAHADALEQAEHLHTILEERFQPCECLLSSVTAALGVHVGPGAWAVFYQIEEPADTDRNIPSSEPL
jgi:DegV family protein with EDD domain